MSDLVKAVEISGIIFVVVMITQYGTRHFNFHRIALPFLSVAGFGYAYLNEAPISSSSIVFYLAGAAIGSVFAVLAYATTAMWRDGDTGKLMTRSGPAFVAVWLTAMAARIGFVWATSNVPAFRQSVGEHMTAMHLTTDMIAPFFVIWALTMVIGRIIGLLVHSRTVRTEIAVDPTAFAEGSAPRSTVV